MDEATRKWLEDNQKICLCQGIPRQKFVRLIQDGIRQLPEINRRLGSGRGSCQGKRCQDNIRQLIEDYS